MDIVRSARSFSNLDYSHRNPDEPMNFYSTDNLPADTSYLEVKCTATTVFAVRCPKFCTCARQGEVKFQDRFRHQCMRNCWCNRRIAGTPDPQTSSPPRNLHTVQRTQLNSRVSMGDPQRPRKPRNHGHPASEVHCREIRQRRSEASKLALACLATVPLSCFIYVFCSLAAHGSAARHEPVGTDLFGP